MFCEWCGYDFYEVHPSFEGYFILKVDGAPITGKYCSINCCIASIENIGIEVSERKQQLYSYYNLHIDVSPAPSPCKLIKKGGTMNYYEYRYGFVCPGIGTYEIKNEEYYLSEEEDDGYDSY